MFAVLQKFSHAARLCSPADIFKCSDDEVLVPSLRIMRMNAGQQEYRVLLRQTLCISPKDFLSLVNSPKKLHEAAQASNMTFPFRLRA